MDGLDELRKLGSAPAESSNSKAQSSKPSAAEVNIRRGLTSQEQKVFKEGELERKKQADAQAKQKLGSTLARYYTKFPATQPKKMWDIERISVAELQLEFSRVQTLMDSQSADKTCEAIFGLFFFGIERAAGSLAGYDCTGLATDFAVDHDDMQPEMDELQVMYPWLFNQGLWTRLIMKIGKRVKNKNDERMGKLPAYGAVPELPNKFSDL